MTHQLIRMKLNPSGNTSLRYKVTMLFYEESKVRLNFEAALKFVHLILGADRLILSVRSLVKDDHAQ